MSRITTTMKYSNGWVTVECPASHAGTITITYDGGEGGEIRDLSYRNARDLIDMLAWATESLAKQGKRDEEEAGDL